MGDEKNGCNCISSKHSATELTVTMKSLAYRLFVVVVVVALLSGGSAVCDKKMNDIATEIVSVNSNWWSELPFAYHKELAVAI